MGTLQKMAVQQETLIQAAPEKIWGILSTVDGMKSWLGPEEYEPRVGGKINFLVPLADHQEFMFGEVVTFDPPRTLAFTWTQQIVGDDAWPAATLVTITLTPEAGGTRVRLVHSGFEQLPAEIAEAEFSGYVRGWEMRHVLDRLAKLVEKR